jgi:hypothetical protein
MQITHRWWFWLIIGLLGAFLIVAGFFAWRGIRKYRRYKSGLIPPTQGPNPNGPVNPTRTSSEDAASMELVKVESGHEDGTPEVVKHDIANWTPKYEIDWTEVGRRTAAQRHTVFL